MEHRIADRRVLRLIQKWLAAGVIENGSWTAFEEGVPQGASVSPLLANVYAHYVFDLWAHQWRERHAHGDMIIVRFADDFVVGFEHRDDAERFWADLRDRLAKFGLELNAEKTRLIEFGRFAARDRKARDSASLRRSGFSASRISARRPGSRGGSSSSGSPTRNGCGPSCERSKARSSDAGTSPSQSKDAGSPASCAGTTSTTQCPRTPRRYAPSATRSSGTGIKALRRRSQRTRLTWERMTRLDSMATKPRILHPWPEQRFDANTQGKSPVR